MLIHHVYFTSCLCNIKVRPELSSRHPAASYPAVNLCFSSLQGSLQKWLQNVIVKAFISHYQFFHTHTHLFYLFTFYVELNMNIRNAYDLDDPFHIMAIS